MTRVGSVQRQGKELPLYLVEVSLDTGILDLAERPVMNLNFFGEPWENLQQIDNRSKPGPTSTSGVQLSASRWRNRRWPVLEQWVSGGGNKRIDYPIQVSALIVEMNPQSLDLVDFKPKSTTLRLRDLSGIADPAGRR